MNEWFAQFMRNNPLVPQPPPPLTPPVVLARPQKVYQTNVHHPLTDKIHKCGVEEFLGLCNDDLAKA